MDEDSPPKAVPTRTAGLGSLGDWQREGLHTCIGRGSCQEGSRTQLRSACSGIDLRLEALALCVCTSEAPLGLDRPESRCFLWSMKRDCRRIILDVIAEEIEVRNLCPWYSLASFFR